VHPLLARHTQKVYPWGLAIRTALLLIGVLGGVYPSRTHEVPEIPRIVAWVDFDVEPVRQGVARFQKHLQAQRFEGTRPVELKLIGTDVDNADTRAAAMRQLIATNPALIVASSVNVAKTLLALHTSIPIYFVLQSDPIREGLVSSLVSTGSLTGYTYFVPLDVKIMELLRRVLPDATTIGVVATDYWLEGASMSQDLFRHAQEMGLHLEVFKLHDHREIDPMLRNPRARDVQVWYVPYSEIAFSHGPELAAALASTSVPTVYARRKFLKWGGLLAVQSVDEAAMDVWATSIANILNGVPVGSIPVMRPKEIEIAVNATALAHLDHVTRERVSREATVFE
jgi:putative tryptophan/tyrosine transport system substrate-binding protein